MAQTDTDTAQTSPSQRPDNGVAPRSGRSIAPPIDEQCVWVALHARGWQEGEQGVIEAIIDHLEGHIPAEHRWCVEFGAGDGDQLPLTVAPILAKPGWKGMLIDSDTRMLRKLQRRVSEHTKIIEACVRPSDSCNTIDELMAEYECPPNPAVMVVDVDSIDYHIVEAMASRPIVLCVETLDMNSPQHAEHAEEAYIPSLAEAGKIVEDNFGAQLQANTVAFDDLLGARGYSLVFRTRFNSIYVRSDMAIRLRKTKLNLGAGPTKFPGYVNLDIKTGQDISKLDYPDNYADEIYVSHVLEHFPYEQRAAILAEWVRVLKPWGSLKIAVPDMRKLAAEILKDEPAHALSYIEGVVYGGHDDANDHHKAMFTEATLRGAMYRAGLGSITPFKAFMPDCSTNHYSLNLEGVKRWYPKVEKPRIALVMSQPELAHTQTEIALLETVKELTKAGVDVRIEPPKGAFWDRDMSIGTQCAIEKHDPDFLFYCDYDGVFEASDVLTLLDTINSDPTMAAIGPVQMSRHHDAPLVMDPEIEYSGDITRVRYSHFALTAVRREVIEEMLGTGVPLFWSVPGKNDRGEWDWQAWGRTDADITFWRNMDLMGFKVYQHNKVVVGHNIRAIKYPRDKGRGVQIIPIENYRRHGKPKDAVFNPECYKPKPKEGGTA